MNIILSTLKKVLFWSYERGSWQYDLMCVLILAFIFLSPNRVFQTRADTAPLIVRGAEIGPVEPNNLEQAITEYMKRSGHTGTISRIEQGADGTGEITYVIYQK